MVSPPPVLTLMSSSVVIPDRKSTISDLKLSVSDLPMLSCHYIQKGCLFTRPTTNISIESLIPLLQLALSRTLSHFPPLAGRLITDDDGYVYIACNDAGAEFLHVKSAGVSIGDVICPTHVPEFVRGFFAFQPMVSYQGHSKALLAVQVTELADGVFVGATCNHAVVDGTSFWNFFNTFAEICRRINIGKNDNVDGADEKISRKPDFSRNSVLISPAVLKLPAGGPTVTFDENAPLKERIFSFSRASIQELKALVNRRSSFWLDNGDYNAVSEIMGKQIHDKCQSYDGKKTEDAKILESCLSQNGVVEPVTNKTEEISSFQALCALLWRAVTRARKLPTSKTTTFRMAVNCRHRLNPKLDPLYFGNAIQSIPTTAKAGEVTSRDLRWCAEQLSFSVKDYNEEKVRKVVSEWESNPRCFPLGNFDGAMITMGSSPRFPMFDNDFGWGRPVAVRSGGGNKFDGKISAFPGREGNGRVDLEVVLAPETMDEIESDSEFMRFVSC